MELAAAGEAPVVSAVYVNLAPHPKILQATQQWLHTFALQPQACYGRSLTMISGPDTVWQLLSAALAAARSGQQATARVVLYSSTGDRALYSVSALPSQALGQQQAVKLCMRRTDAVSYKLAAAEDGQCTLLVSAERPFRITWLSGMFERRFGLKADDVISRTLGIIHGPQTDLRAWLELIEGALAGCSTNGVVSVYTREGTAATEDICCTPVLGKDDIEFVRITIGGITRSRSAKKIEARRTRDVQERCAVGRTRSRSASPAGGERAREARERRLDKAVSVLCPCSVVEPSPPRRCRSDELDGRALMEKAASKVQDWLDDVYDGGPRDRPQVQPSTQDVQMPRHRAARAPLSPNAVRNILRTQEIVADFTRTPPRVAKNARSTSMGSVKKHIAMKSRRQLEEARLLEAEEQPIAVDTSGFWACLLSLMMMVLVRCNLMSPRMPCQSRETRKGEPSKYSNSWMHLGESGLLDCEGMSVCDLDGYTPY